MIEDTLEIHKHIAMHKNKVRTPPSIRDQAELLSNGNRDKNTTKRENVTQEMQVEALTNDWVLHHGPPGLGAVEAEQVRTFQGPHRPGGLAELLPLRGSRGQRQR